MIHSPFKFLDSYTKEDSKIFFGRESKATRSPLTPSRGNFQRAFQKLSEPAGKLAPLGVRGSDGLSCKTFPISRSKSQQPMAKIQKLKTKSNTTI
jgi:hypothetical protein